MVHFDFLTKILTSWYKDPDLRGPVFIKPAGYVFGLGILIQVRKILLYRTDILVQRTLTHLSFFSIFFYFY